MQKFLFMFLLTCKCKAVASISQVGRNLVGIGKTTLTIYQHHNVAIVCGLGRSSSPAMQLETH